jgi:hypothetical protein
MEHGEEHPAFRVSSLSFVLGLEIGTVVQLLSDGLRPFVLIITTDDSRMPKPYDRRAEIANAGAACDCLAPMLTTAWPRQKLFELNAANLGAPPNPRARLLLWGAGRLRCWPRVATARFGYSCRIKSFGSFAIFDAIRRASSYVTGSPLRAAVRSTCLPHGLDSRVVLMLAGSPPIATAPHGYPQISCRPDRAC